ncbi:T9SS type B sorting domain-containing protein, partial [Flavobacterium humi]
LPGSVIGNDTLNGNPVTTTNTNVTPAAAGPLSVDADGIVSVAANTPSGTYVITYQLCEADPATGLSIVPANCDTATATVIVNNVIDAVIDPAVTVSSGSAVTILPGSVIGNDTLNGNPVTIANTNVTPAAAGPLSVDADGIVSVAANTPSGTYVITYQLCEADPATGLSIVPANCDTATATVIVLNPIDADDDEETTTAGSTGVTGILNVLDNDTLSGDPTNLTQVTLTVVTPDPTGQIILNPDGSVNVLPGTPAGTYTITYQICENGAVPANCDTATVTIIVNTNEDIDIYNHVTPNGDGDNEVFFIDGINKYPDNTVEIYNRWGVLVYEVAGYNNTDKAFRGVSEGRVTVNRLENLPEGTYYYILRYKKPTGEAKEKSGYLYINR